MNIQYEKIGILFFMFSGFNFNDNKINDKKNPYNDTGNCLTNKDNNKIRLQQEQEVKNWYVLHIMVNLLHYGAHLIVNLPKSIRSTKFKVLYFLKNICILDFQNLLFNQSICRIEVKCFLNLFQYWWKIVETNKIKLILLYNRIFLLIRPINISFGKSERWFLMR